MRITVTVVVIMFELTGALTYILPTMVRRAIVTEIMTYTGLDRIIGYQSCW